MSDWNPQLTEDAIKDAENLMEEFRRKMLKVAEEILGDLYTDTAMYIESDSWGNFRNDLRDSFLDYKRCRDENPYMAGQIRAKLLRDFKDEITNDLNQDLIDENEKFKKHIKTLQDKIVKLEEESGGF